MAAPAMGLRAVVLRAAAALPQGGRECAVAALRSQLCVMADSAGGTPDWTTLMVAGPTEMPGAPEEARFEWVASVVVQGESVVDVFMDQDEEAVCCSGGRGSRDLEEPLVTLLVDGRPRMACVDTRDLSPLDDG